MKPWLTLVCLNRCLSFTELHGSLFFIYTYGNVLKKQKIFTDRWCVASFQKKETGILLKDVTAFTVMCRAHINWNLSVRIYILIIPTTAESSLRGDCHECGWIASLSLHYFYDFQWKENTTGESFGIYFYPSVYRILVSNKTSLFSICSWILQEFHKLSTHPPQVSD